MKKLILLLTFVLCYVSSYSQIATTVVYGNFSSIVFNSLIVNTSESTSYEVPEWTRQQITIPTGVATIATSNRYIRGTGTASYTITFEGIRLSNISRISNPNNNLSISASPNIDPTIKVTVNRSMPSYQSIFRADIIEAGKSTPFATGVIFAITGGNY